MDDFYGIFFGSWSWWRAANWMLNSISLCIFRHCSFQSFFFFFSPPPLPPTTLPLCTFRQGYLLFHLSAPIVFYTQTQYVLNLWHQAPSSLPLICQLMHVAALSAFFTFFAFALRQTGSIVVVLQGHLLKWLWSEKVAKHLAATFSINWNNLKWTLHIFELSVACSSVDVFTMHRADGQLIFKWPMPKSVF